MNEQSSSNQGATESMVQEVRDFRIDTEARVPKLGVMLVGMGGNNGATLIAGILANKLNIEW